MNKILKQSLSALVLFSVLLTACNSTPTARTTSTTENALCSEPASPAPHLPAGDVQNLAKTDKEDGNAYTFAEDNGAQIIPVDNGMSFAVWWQPEGFDITKDTVVVSLHGHGSWATQDFKVWYPRLTERKVAYLGLQWWFGRSLENEGYYEPDQIYRLIAEELKAKGVPVGHVIFEGFSMGGARSYGVNLYDHLCGDNYFGVNIANSGPWENDYPLYAKILSGIYGEKPFEDTRWILFCGETDVNEHPSTPELANVCTGMTATQTTLTSLGATVDLFIKDPTGDHGSFMINADNVNEAMDEAEKILAEKKSS
jgi:hypothetical protein